MNETTNPADSTESALDPLTPVQARIVGCLVEKQATTPDVYPLTLNALVVACNQKTSRDPLLDLDPGEVGHAVRQLEGIGLVKATLGARASRYEHRFDSHYSVTPRQRTLLALLLLRGPQTINELYQRSERMADFPEADEVRVQLDRLAQRPLPLVVCIGRAGGQREDRYMHLLCGPVDAELLAAQRAEPSERADSSPLSARVAALEAEVAALRESIERIHDRIGSDQSS